MFTFCRKAVIENPAVTCQSHEINDATMPASLKTLREKFEHWERNPLDYIVPGSLEKAGGWSGDAYRFHKQPLEEALEIEFLGSGHYSNVYTFNETSVLKVVKTTDKGYARFVRAIRDIDNPHFPRILYAGVWAGRQVYLLEKLSPMASGSLCYQKGEHVREAFSHAKNPYLTITDTVMAEAAKILADNGLLSDLHGENLMWRGDVPVVTDPCSDG